MFASLAPQLEALASELTALSIVIPVISAFSFLLLGGLVAIFVLPKFLSRFVLSHFSEDKHSQLEVRWDTGTFAVVVSFMNNFNIARFARRSLQLAIMFALLLGMMPATHYAKASFLMGAFLAGLTFCRSHGLHHLWGGQFKRVLQWLMRIFFAASIGFQVPIKGGLVDLIR